MTTTDNQKTTPSTSNWALSEFGHAQLGHLARTKRVVKMAERMFESPSGLLTQTFRVSAEREGAYRALENTALEADGLNVAATHAAVRRAGSFESVYIPVDLTSLTLKSSPAVRLSEIGNKNSRSKGVHVHNSLIVSTYGQVLGMGHQVYFRRKRRRKKLTRNQRRKLKLAEKETRHWLTCIQKTEAAFEAEQSDTKRCYLLDRGGDFREMLAYGARADHRVIIRSSWDRRLVAGKLDAEEKRYLRAELHKAPILGRFQMDVAAGPNRTARQAVIELRAEQYTFRLKNKWTHQVTTAPMWVVWAREVSAVPDGQKKLEWRLITNRSVDTFEEAAEVVYGYRRRWSIEEMHRCWKTVCGVEKTRLRSYETIVKFATLMASVAARIEHLKTASRSTPDAPASHLFSAAELKAITVLRFDPGSVPEEEPTAQKAVQWVAQLGGYIGPRNGPPGAETIARGMLRVQGGVDMLVRMGWKHEPPWPLEKSDQ